MGIATVGSRGFWRRRIRLWVPDIRPWVLNRHNLERSSCLVYRILYRFLAALASLSVRSGPSKDLEIIVLRQQLMVLRRQDSRPPLNDNDRTLLGALADEVRRLIIAMATDNPTWGYRRIHGELTGLGHRVGASTVWTILKRHGLDPAPQRSSVTWTDFLRSQAAVACDFATIDTAFLRRYYLLFFIDVSTREVFFVGITANPTGAWTTQAVRSLSLRHHDRLADARGWFETGAAGSSMPSTRSSEPKASRSSRPLSAHRSPTRSRNAGSEPCGASSSTAPSSGTSDSSNASSSTTSTTTTPTDPIAHSTSEHHSRPRHNPRPIRDTSAS